MRVGPATVCDKVSEWHEMQQSSFYFIQMNSNLTLTSRGEARSHTHSVPPAEPESVGDALCAATELVFDLPKIEQCLCFHPSIPVHLSLTSENMKSKT